jgi:hypothetical protein
MKNYEQRDKKLFKRVHGERMDGKGTRRVHLDLGVKNMESRPTIDMRDSGAIQIDYSSTGSPSILFRGGLRHFPRNEDLVYYLAHNILIDIICTIEETSYLLSDATISNLSLYAGGASSGYISGTAKELTAWPKN